MRDVLNHVKNILKVALENPGTKIVSESMASLFEMCSRRSLEIDIKITYSKLLINSSLHGLLYIFVLELFGCIVFYVTIRCRS